jgi:hypothetical protein
MLAEAAEGFGHRPSGIKDGQHMAHPCRAVIVQFIEAAKRAVS